MSTNTVKPIPLGVKVLHFARLAFAAVARIFFCLYYGRNGKRLPPINDSILKLPAVDVARKIRNKQITSVEVLDTCIRRINDVNDALNCFVEDRFEDARKEALEADELIRSGTMTMEALEKEKPFLGVPFTTKDCIAVKGLHHTSGVMLRKNVIAKEDSDVIRLLREKGAIIIGLTNVPELCMWWETHNQIHGRTSNPYNTTRIVGGSSGGEGCIQSAAGSIFGIGSDIGGSIRMPSFFNGIFGHKTSRGVVSNFGQYPVPKTKLQDSFLGIGPMTRYAVDLKPILNIIAGENSSKLNLDQPVDIAKLKIFYQINSGTPMTDPVDHDIVEGLKNAVNYFDKQYKINAEEKKIPLLQNSVKIWMSTMKGKQKFGALMMENSSIPKILFEMVKTIFGLSDNTFIALCTALFDYSGPEYGSPKFNHYLEVRESLEVIFKDMLGDNGVFLYPTHPTPAPHHNEPVIKPMNFSYTAIINCLGLPATTIPLGLGREGLPIGIQVVANHNNDRLCLAVAEELEKAFGGWIPPT